ncbi:MAG TPA: response regulator [Chthoniobacter sp.]
MSSNPNYRILVIDDNRAIHGDFRKILCPEQGDFDAAEAEFFERPASGGLQPEFVIDSAYQGAEGVALARQAVEDGRPYAMAFVDVRMPPGMDGLETAGQLWQVCPELQIVICTAYSDYSWQEMISRLGNRDRLLVLKKPFASVEALQLASALCEKWQLTRASRDRLAETEKIVEERTRELREACERLEKEMEQRQEAEAHLLRAQRLESIGTLASGIAHDLNNLLSPILMSVGLLPDSPPETSAELISTIETCAERAADLVRQVLTFARGIEGVRVPLEPKYLIHEVEKIITGTFPRQISLKSQIADDLWVIEGDATQLHQVLVNLAVNARDAMPEGGTLKIDAANMEVDENYAAMVPGLRLGRFVRIRIADTGTGIPPQVMAKIFDPFFTTKPLGKGTGLGLSTAIGIVKGHEGFIDVHSELGKGTIFEVFLPVSADNLPFDVPEPNEVQFDGRGQLILIVDDESAVRKVCETALKQRGYRTISASDGAEALSIYASEAARIDLVLTDVMMPAVDGVALCRVLRKMNPAVPIIAATGAAEETRKQELRALNVNALLAKPFGAGTLLAALEEVFAKKLASDRTVNQAAEQAVAA